jgi:Ca-activated chloride channel family protein
MRSLLAFALLTGSLGALTAQAPPAPPAGQEELNRITVGVSNVNLQFTVTDRRGRFVTGLGKDDFLVREGKNAQKILQFSSESELPLRLAILVDSSNSIRDRFRFIQETAIEFINSVMRPGKDKAMVVSFDTATELQVDLTGDKEKLTNAIRNLRAGGGTTLYDAIAFASRDKLMQEVPRYGLRYAMVILSDGDDNQSRYSRDQALELAQLADVVIYTISTSSVMGARGETGGDKILKYLSSETGGLTFFPFKVEDLSQSFENIANELRHQYSLLYRPEPLKTDGSYQLIEVRVPTQGNLVIRARRGYYAPRF